MKEFIEKLIGRLEEIKDSACDGISCEECKYKRWCNEGEKAENVAIDKAIDIVNQLAEEYNQNINQDLMIVESLPSLYPLQDFEEKAIHSVVASAKNTDWISVAERLPEEKENPITHDYMQYPVMVNINGTVDMRYYYYGDGHWRYGFEIKDKYVTHWMDINPYQPEGE